MANTYSAGIVTAYGAAKKAGYTGTYEEFCADQANFARYAQQVREDKESVEQTVETFSETTVPAAVQSVTDEGNKQIDRVTAAGTTAVGNVNDAGTTQVGNVNNAGTTQVGNVNSAGTTQVGNVNEAGTNQVNAVNTAGATQVQAVEDKGDEVIGSIPQDYTDLVDDVADLTRQLSDLEDTVSTTQIINTASGAIASFDDGADSMPVKKLVAQIVPQQAGTGDPSPDNVRPISGWTAAILGNTVPAPESGITFPFEAKQAGSGDPSPTNIRPISGYDLTLEDETHVTVYGGTVTLNEDGSADVVVSNASRVYDNEENILKTYLSGSYYQLSSIPYLRGNWQLPLYCSHYERNGNPGIIGGNNSSFWIRGYDYTNIEGFRDFLRQQAQNGTPLCVVWEMATPQTYHFPNIGQLKTFFSEIGYAAQLLPINWQSEAGTIYGGTVTLNEDGSADVVITRRYAVYDGDENWSWSTNSGRYNANVVATGIYRPERESLYAIPCNYAKPGNNSVTTYFAVGATWQDSRIYFFNPITYLDGVEDLATFKAYLAQHPLEVVYPLATPQTYHFDNIGQLKTFLGTNNVWCDTGAITECDYPADTKLYIDNKIAELQALILEH